jgi:PAS domain S-box-containing protein
VDHQTYRIPAFLDSFPAAVLAVALSYAATAQLSILFSFQASRITPIFPAAGIALAALLVLGRPALLGVWLGSFATLAISLAGERASAGPFLLVSLAGSAGATAAAGAGRFLVRRACAGQHPLDSARGVASLVTLGALCSAIGATMGVLGMCLGGYLPWHGLGLSWITRWVGDVSGMIMAAPLVLVLFHPRRRAAGLLDEREAKEQALREREAKFRAVVENSHEGVIFLDARAVISYRSPSASVINGFTPEDRLGRSGFEAVHPDDLAEARRGWDRLLREPETDHQFQLRLRHKDGSWLWAEGSARNLLGNPDVQAVVMTMRDITASKMAELELQQSRANLNSVLESTTDLIWSVDKDFRLLVWNTGYAEHILRCYGGEVRRGETHFDRLPPERAVLWPPLYDRAIHDGPFQCEYPIPDGRLLELSFHPTRSGGLIMGVSVFGKDITAQRKAEAAVRKVSTAVARSQASIVITDKNGAIEYVNPRFVEVTGYSVEEALGQNPRILKTGDQSAAFYRELWETISGGHVWHGEFQNQRKGGGIFWESATIAPIKDDQGTITGYVAIKDDITEHKRAGEERIKLQTQLLQAQKLESIGRLAGGVAHDFNNMLSVILSNSELALHHLGPGHPAAEKMDVIMKATLRSADLTRQLLAFARQQAVMPRVLDLNHAIEGMLKMLRRIIGEDIAIAWIPGLRLWRTFMDPTQVDQILANLLVNARDAIKGEGEGKVIITTQNVHLDPAWSGLQMGARTGDFVLLTVSDDGCGMDAETREKIFEPFFTTKDMGQGTGLGLATVHGTVHQSGGFINVYSEPRLGTTFKIYLPRHLGAETEWAEQAEAAALPRGTETVVLVEDNSVLLHSICAILGALGYNVLPVSEPKEAIRLAQEFPGPLHLLLTDLVMPGMNGRDLALAFQSACPGIKCLYMSGYTADIISRQGILSEGLQFIQKPFSSHDIANKLRSVLGAGQA